MPAHRVRAPRRCPRSRIASCSRSAAFSSRRRWSSADMLWMRRRSVVSAYPPARRSPRADADATWLTSRCVPGALPHRSCPPAETAALAPDSGPRANLPPSNLDLTCASSSTAHRAAAVAAERVYYAAHVEVLEADHPERPFVAALCLYSHAVDTGEAACAIYDQEDAERFARELLMPAEEFAPLIAWPDVELAEVFAAPLDQVAIRRREAAPPSAPQGV